jgi:hypothetical protein
MVVVIALFSYFGLCSLAFLNDKTIDVLVNGRLPHEVIAILFEDSGQPSPDFQAAFRNASQTLEGMVKFGALDVRRYRALDPAYRVDSAPAIRLFSESGVTVYRGQRTTKAIVKAAADLIPDHTLPVTDSWRDEAAEHPFAIFFTTAARFPPVWKSVALHYNATKIRIGATNSSIHASSYNVASIPAIYAANNSTYGYYKGQLQLSALLEWLDTFFAAPQAKTRKSHTPTNEIERPDQFPKICVGGSRLCVVVKESVLNPEISALRKEFGKLKMNWFVGIEGLPYEFMKTGTGSWVYNPKRDAFAHATSVDDLKGVLESVENGQAKWTKENELNEL